MKAVILAAGLGINPTDDTPKCLLPVGKTTVLERQINILRWCGVEDVTVVVGDRGKCWNKKIQQRIRKSCDKIVANPHNLVTKSSYSLSLALEDIEKGPVLAIDGDVVFDKEAIRALIASEHETVLISRPALSISEAGGKILLDGILVKKAGENIRPKEFLWNIYSGIIKLGNDIYDELKKELPRYKKEHVLDVIQALCKKHRIYNLNLDEIKEEETPSFLIGGSHATLKRRILVRKETYREGREKLIQEIEWLKNLPRELQSYFPKIIDCSVSANHVWYEAPYYSIPSLRKLLFTGEIDAKKALEILENVMGFMFTKVFSQNQREGDPSWVYKLHIQRINKRLLLTQQRASVFDSIIKAREVILNNKTYENISSIIAKIKVSPSLIRSLAPPIISMVHGDLHFQNILVNMNNKEKFNFILTDPRGELNGSDPIYDIGKLWHSFHGLYDFMHEDMFELDSDVQGSRVRAYLEFTDIPALNEYKKIGKSLPKNLEKYPLLLNDPKWKMRTLFTEAAHFCSIMPFHLKMDGVEKRAIALYLTGVKLVNEFAKKYEVQKYKEDLSWVNINTPEEYLRAVRISGEQN